jgi:hypothetical protein
MLCGQCANDRKVRKAQARAFGWQTEEDEEPLCLQCILLWGALLIVVIGVPFTFIVALMYTVKHMGLQ